SRLGYQFYLGPVLLLGCFLPLIEKKWRIVIILLLLIMIFADFGARSQVLKSLIAIVVACACSFSYAISTNVLRLVHWFFYILPVILLGLGMGGSFNVFQDLNSNEGKYKQTRIIDGNLIEEDLSADTRTLLYEEVIGSALTHEYWLFGRTPARGNDS